MKKLKQLQAKLPLFTWTESDGNFFGTINQSLIIKRINKDIYKLSNVNIFISSQMYPKTDRDFRYAICYQRAEQRPYRCKNWSGFEYARIFVSAKDLEGIIVELVKNIDMNKFYLSK